MLSSVGANLSIELGMAQTMRQKAEERRTEKLELVREQVENGSLVIRMMTAEERRQHPARPRRPRNRREN